MEGLGLDHCIGRLALVRFHNYSIIRMEKWKKCKGEENHLQGKEMRDKEMKGCGIDGNNVKGKVLRGKE